MCYGYGLSIPGRYERSGINFEDECHAIEKAVSGVSSIQDKERSRGLGLRTTLKLVIEGNKGNFLIVSGNGSLHVKNKNNYKYKFNVNIF